MTDAEPLGQWLDRELAGVPQELAVRIRGALPANWRGVPNSDAAALLANAAAHELRGLLDERADEGLQMVMRPRHMRQAVQQTHVPVIMLAPAHVSVGQ